MVARISLPTGQVLIVSGQDSGGPIGTAELFDPSTQAFAGAGSLSTPREFETVTLFNDGTVLIAGGLGSAPLGSAELYAPPLPAPLSVQITPPTTSMILGQTQQFKALDDLGHQRFDVNWTVSDPTAATITVGSSPTLTAAGPGQITLTADVEDVTWQLQITIAPSFLQVTPAMVNMQVGGSRQFTVVNNLGVPSTDVNWTVSDSSLATITTDNPPTLTAVAPGVVTLTAIVEGVSSQAQVTISPVGAILPGAILWSASPSPGFSPVQLSQAVPTASGPDLYSTQVSADRTQAVVQALTADGQQQWQSSLPVVNNSAVPDGAGGLIVREHQTCNPGQTDPTSIVDLSPTTGQPQWQITAQPSINTGGTASLYWLSRGA
jgi:hypothetical protein